LSTATIEFIQGLGSLLRPQTKAPSKVLL